MNLEILNMAGSALTSNKTRTALSALGVVIGVSTVILVVGIGLGAEQKVEQQFKNLSANSLIIMSEMGHDAIGSSKLGIEDVDLVKNASMVKTATAMLGGNVSAAYGKESASKRVIGGTAEIFPISNLNIGAGRAFTDEESADRANVAVLGWQVANDLFGDGNENDSVGKTITLKNKKFEVIGVLEKNGSGMPMLSPDDSVYVPILTAEKALFGSTGMFVINAQITDVKLVDVATYEITTMLRKAHNIRKGRADDFQIRDAGSMVAAATGAAAMMTNLLISVAAIVLLVSGIGIMNVMFVTVTERTREIGIIKAIGGRQKDILTQFLLEAIILSITGGVLGIIIGFSAIPLLNQMEGWYVMPSLKGALLGFIFSGFVGIFFGFYPALRASRLDPVDALRGE
ncbi:MAG: ABC transporter permease [Patescibacteria group bacterium]|nr:ABC transporter permease [Patescibacteria group bacterium]